MDSPSHNGILDNDSALQKQYRLPKTKIGTDSFVAVQLLEKKKTLDSASIKFMAETVAGSFSFSILDSANTLWLVKGDSPLAIVHLPKYNLYIYASTEEILYKALVDTKLFQEVKNGNFEEIQIRGGDILNILPDGTLVWDRFDYREHFGGRHWYDYDMMGDYAYSGSQMHIDDLKMVAAYQGYSEDEIDELLANGFSLDEIEEYIYCQE